MATPFVVSPRSAPAAAKPAAVARLRVVEDAGTDSASPRPIEGAAPPRPVGWVPARRSEDAADPAAGVAPLASAPPVIAFPPGPARERHRSLRPFVAYLDDPRVTDIFVNGSAGLFVDRGAGAVPAREWRATEEEVRDLAVALIAAGDRHLDDATPCVDVRLGDGIRIHAVLPPVAPEGTVLSIRVPRMIDARLDDLAATGMFGPSARRMLDEAIVRRTNLLVSGAAGAGKTTLLASLLGEAAPHERIITIEDVAELRIAHPHHVRLEARQANLEGAGGIGLARLVREALRMRPDRLVVGECRGDEVRELLSALNTGHDGGAGTVHANGLHDVPARLEALGALAGLGDTALARQAASAIGLILHVERGAAGERRLAGIGRPIVGADGRLAVEEVPCDAG